MGKIQCDICKKKCRGDVLKLDKRYIHKDCFKCSECQQSLENGGFFYRENRYYCHGDYQKKFGVKCGVCQQFVEGESITIMGNNFHSNCFHCQSCKKPFNCGDKATLLNNRYLCDSCYGDKEKENVSPHKTNGNTDGIVTTIDVSKQSELLPSTYTMATVPMAGPGDSSDAETIIPTYQKQQLHSMNGYTSTDSGMEKTAKSEMPYHNNLHSPEYSTTSGDESWANAIRDRKTKTLPYQFGKYYNESYLKIRERTEQTIPPRSFYNSKAQSNTTGYYRHNSANAGSGYYMNQHSMARNSNQYYRPGNTLSYRSIPNIHAKKGMSMLINGPMTTQYPKSNRSRNQPINSSQSTADIKSMSTTVSTDEVKRLAHYPNASEPDETYQAPIDRYDFPAPPSLSVMLLDRKRAQQSSSHRPTQSTGDISLSGVRHKHPQQSGMLSGLELTSDDSSMTTVTGIKDEKERNRRIQKKRERQLEELRLLRSRSGMSQSLLDQLETSHRLSSDNQLDVDNQDVNVDPISASRSPDASWEPHQKPRFDRHTFTSPSRDSRFEGRPVHSLASNMNYSSTGGRTGNMSGYNSSTEYDPIVRQIRGYRPYDTNQNHRGYMSCVENTSSTLSTNQNYSHFHNPNNGPMTTANATRPSNHIERHQSHDYDDDSSRPYSSLGIHHHDMMSNGIHDHQHAHHNPHHHPHHHQKRVGQMTPMTTSAYSMDDESTLIGGSGVISGVTGEMIHDDGVMNGAGDGLGHSRSVAASAAGYHSDIGGLRQVHIDSDYCYDTDSSMPLQYPTVQSYLKPSNKFLQSHDKLPPQIYPYETLKISNFSLPKGVDRNNLEVYLNNSDFEMVFNMSRKAFARLPLWKRNDLKKKMDLY